MRIPVTILSGYLGAGKTTIINHILSAPLGRRIAVLVNDFGQVNIDASLIENTDGETVSLTNGCVCCSIGGDLGDALAAQVNQPNPPDQILLEASGVSDPARIARIAGNWPSCQLDAIVTAVDVETFEQRRTDKFVGRMVMQQIEVADVLLLTRTDRSADTVSDQLRSLNPSAPMHHAPNGQVDLRVLLGLHDPRLEIPDSDADHLHVSTVFWKPSEAIHGEILLAHLANLPAEFHRAKGFFRDEADGSMKLIQCVGKRCELLDAPESAQLGLVFLAALPKEEMQTALDQLRAQTKIAS